MFIMESSSRQLVKENPSGIQYFTCWSEHMKHSDMVLFEETIRKLQTLPGIEPIRKAKSQ